MKTEYEYILMSRLPQKGTTAVWQVENKSHGYRLGDIKWYGPFRQYAFFPAGGGLVFSIGCMADISEFIKALAKEYRDAKKDV